MRSLYLMCSRACRVRCLYVLRHCFFFFVFFCNILQPLFQFPHPTLCVCVCLMPFPLRHGTGQPLRSGEVFRSQIPREKALFPPVQKQISGLPCWDQVYVSVSPPADVWYDEHGAVKSLQLWKHSGKKIVQNSVNAWEAKENSARLLPNLICADFSQRCTWMNHTSHIESMLFPVSYSGWPKRGIIKLIFKT